MTTPKAECDSLMNMIFPVAEQMLQESGEFHPYGAALKENGEYVCLSGYDGNDHPSSKNIIRLLKDGFILGAESGVYKATALIFDVKVTLPSEQKSDAIAVALDHRDNYSVIVFFPYQLKNGQLSLGEAFANKGDADIFPLK